MKSAWARGISGNRKVVSTKVQSGNLMSNLGRKMINNSKGKDKGSTMQGKSEANETPKDSKVHVRLHTTRNQLESTKEYEKMVGISKPPVN